MLRIFGYYVPKPYVLLAVCETAAFFLSLILGALARFGWSLSEDSELFGLVASASVYAIVMTSSLTSMGLYQRGLQQAEAGFVVRMSLAFVLGTCLMALFFYAVPTVFVGRGILGLGLIFSFIAVTLIRETFARLANVESLKRRLLVVGAGFNAKRIDDLVSREPRLAFVVVGYLPLPNSPTVISDDKLIHDERLPLDIAMRHGVDEIVLAADDRRGILPVDDLVECRMSGFEVVDLLTFFEKELALVKIDLLYPSWIFLAPHGFGIGLSGLYGKRIFDVAVGILMLAVTAPIMCLVAVASLIESRGRDPVFYHQVRVGEGGKLFRLHKFRSMRVDAEADGVPRWASERDSRITPIGGFLRKTRLDELPQVFNVLKGQMSLVGPRPERPEFVQHLSAAIPYYCERHRVKPGVTGWAQLLYPYGSGDEDAKRKLEFDLYYVKHAGIILDLVIILQTVEVVVFGKGAR